MLRAASNWSYSVVSKGIHRKTNLSEDCGCNGRQKPPTHCRSRCETVQRTVRAIIQNTIKLNARLGNTIPFSFFCVVVLEKIVSGGFLPQYLEICVSPMPRETRGRIARKMIERGGEGGKEILH